MVDNDNIQFNFYRPVLVKFLLFTANDFKSINEFQFIFIGIYKDH